MRFNVLHHTALSTALAGVANAQYYMFDASCSATPGMLDFVKATFTNALVMSQAAYAATSQTPLNQGVSATLDSLVQIAPPNQTVAQKAAAIFGRRGVSRFTTEVTDNNLLGTNDLKIYCDLSRFEQRRSDERWVDTDITRNYQNYTNCKASNIKFDPENFALMYTIWNSVRRDAQGNIIAGESFHQIQICPFFLLWALPLRSHLNTVLLPRILWWKMTFALVRKIRRESRYTPIDGVSLIDKVLLHELTHATTDPLIKTRDVPINDGPAYGWELCTALSTNPNASTNADTWALFGSIAWQIQEGLITGVNADGTINKP